MIFAVIPAAGKSTRMGRPKLSLPLGERTVLERVIDALHAGGVNHIVVVIGPHTPELIPMARAANASVCQLPRETPDMRATVEAGLAWIAERWDMQRSDSFLLCPADHPCLDAGVVRDLLRAESHVLSSSIFVPTFEGRRGHPTLISWRHVAGIRALPPDTGLNVYLRQLAAETISVPSSSAVLLDLDTPADYEMMQVLVQSRCDPASGR